MERGREKGREKGKERGRREEVSPVEVEESRVSEEEEEVIPLE